MKTYVCGADVGGTTVKLGIFKTTGELLKEWEIPTRTEEGGKAILPDISQAIDTALAELGIAKADVEGLGIGVPGPVLSDGTINKAINLNWGVFNIVEKMEALSGLRVKAGNDANVAALGEMWQGGGEGCKNIVMVTLGTGIGAGIIINEHILTGANGGAGEAGHMTMEVDEEEVCGCGKKGCFEQYASANGTVRVARRYLAAHPEVETVLKADHINSKIIFDEAQKGDRAALAIVDQVSQYLGRGFANIACVVDPEVFVIGGGMSKSGQILIDGIKKYYKKYVFHASAHTEFRTARLQNRAGIYGCARMLLD